MNDDRMRRLRAMPDRLADFWGTRPGIAAFVVLSGLIYAFLIPGFGLDAASLAALLGLVGGLVVVILAFDLPARQYHGARTGDLGRLRVYPGSILVGIACVLLSKVANFQPGYLYGLVVGYQFHREMSGADEGRSAALRAMWALGASLVAWLALAVVTPANPATSSLVDLALDTMLATVVVAGVEGALFELFPLRFLPGEVVYAWRRPVWAALFAVSAFAFVAVLINPASGYLSNTRQIPLLVALALFTIFAIVSVGFWGYFRFRHTPPPRPPMARLVGTDASGPRPAKRPRRRKGGGEGGI